MKKTRLALFILICCLSACKSTPPTNITTNINDDFPNTKELNFTHLKDYDILASESILFVDDNVLWHFDYGASDEIGSCYNLMNGEKLSTIATRGKARNEFSQFPENISFTDDSIRFMTYNKDIKSFAKSDIINNKPLSERKMGITSISKNLKHKLSKITTLNDGSIVAMCDTTGKNDNLSFVKINNGKITNYDIIDLTKPDIKKVIDYNSSFISKIILSYKNGGVKVTNDKAVLYTDNNFILNTIDLKNATKIKEKKYGEFVVKEIVDGDFSYTTVSNDSKFRILNVSTNKKEIVCIVEGYFTEKDSVDKKTSKNVFVFNWNLKPINRYSLPELEKGSYKLSLDGKHIYKYRETSSGFSLDKAEV